MFDLQKLKKKSLSEALTCSLSVSDSRGEEIAKLVPIGNWALNDENLLHSFASWRKTFSRFFFTQFETSAQSAASYLKNRSIAQSNRIFFAIYLGDNLIGHMGLNNLDKEEAEIDNFIRGKSGGHSDLMYFSEKTLLTWAFEELKAKTIIGHMLSHNFMAKSLHERFGFKVEERHHLKKIISKNSTTLEKCDEIEATEKFYYDTIKLHKSSFLASLNK